nr:copia protein [Tanacetum cinerariifolium]GEW22172.1 copia protein [Tanacetum cinerariifolium]
MVTTSRICGPMRVESINGKKYVLVIVDDYTRYTWTHFLRSKDETLEVRINFLKLTQRGFHAQDGENLDKTKEKGDTCIFAGYSTQSKGYRVYNKRTRLIAETIHVNFDELPQMASDHISSDPAPKYEIVAIPLNELDMMFSLMFAEYFNGATSVVLKSYVFPTADASDKHQQLNVTSFTSTTVTADISQLDIQTTHEPTAPEPTVIATENIDQAENVIVDEDEFINIFGTSVHEMGKSSSRHTSDGFVDPHHPDKVYHLKKALYGLKQAPRAWYDELSNFLVSKGHLLTASRPDIVHATCYCARYQPRLTKKHLKEVKQIFRYLKNTMHTGLWYPKDTNFKLTAFSDSDHTSCLDTRKSTSDGIQFIRGDKLVSWSSKKQDCTSMLITAAEYLSLSTCCAQVIWMRIQLTKYGFHFDKIPMYCDSKAAIAISCNPIQHSRMKHIDVRYHFIKERVERGIVEILFVGTKYQLADLFTKALLKDRFKYLVR